MKPSQLAELLDRCTASENALKLTKAELSSVTISCDRQRVEMEGARATNASLQKELAKRVSAAAEYAAANAKALRGLEDYKRAYEEAIRRARGYNDQTEVSTAAVLRLREKNTILESQLSLLRGPSGFDLLRQENVVLRQKLSKLQLESTTVRQQAQAEIDGFRHALSELQREYALFQQQGKAAVHAGKERAHASEAARVIASEHARRLEARLASLGDAPSNFRQAEVAASAAAAKDPWNAFTSPRPDAAPNREVPRHLRDIEKWFDGIPKRFRVNVLEAKLAKHLQSNANDKQALKNAIAEVQRLTIEVTPLLPRNVRSHILRGPNGWPSSALSPTTCQAMSVSYSSVEDEVAISTAPASPPAPILATAFAAPGVVPAVPEATS